MRIIMIIQYHDTCICLFLISENDISAAATQDWLLLDLTMVNGALTHIECPSCQDCALAFTKTGVRSGLSTQLDLSCEKCGVLHAQTYSSPRGLVGPNITKEKPYVINDMIVYFFNQIGLGHTALRKFCAIFGMDTLHLRTFQEKEHRVVQTIIDNTDEVLDASVLAVKAAYRELCDGETALSQECITVSFDGSWQKRGHTSLYGFAAVIDVLTGLVLDYEILSKYCHVCAIKKAELGESSVEFEAWKETHDNCAVNYEGSSNSMEVEVACRIWSRSVVKTGLKYTGFLSDGDSKAFTAVQKMDPYSGLEIQKEECLNHAHKRMGTALINLSKEKKLGGKGHGRLTKEKAIVFQWYYRNAIENNLGNVEAMRNAVWASLFHSMSSDNAPQHDKCPAGMEFWCFYQCALAKGEDPPAHEGHIKNAISPEVAKSMTAIYERMTDSNLLKKMQRGLTQNANESLHSVIWSRCPKTVFVGKQKLHGAVASAVASYNEGTVHMSQVNIRIAYMYVMLSRKIWKLGPSVGSP